MLDRWGFTGWKIWQNQERIYLDNGQPTGNFTNSPGIRPNDPTGDIYFPPVFDPNFCIPSVSPTPTNSNSVTPSVTPSITPSKTVTPSVTPTRTPSITITPSITLTKSASPSKTPTITVTRTPSLTPSVTRSIGNCTTPVIITNVLTEVVNCGTNNTRIKYTIVLNNPLSLNLIYQLNITYKVGSVVQSPAIVTGIIQNGLLQDPINYGPVCTNNVGGIWLPGTPSSNVSVLQTTGNAPCVRSFTYDGASGNSSCVQLSNVLIPCFPPSPSNSPSITTTPTNTPTVSPTPTNTPSQP